MQLMIRLRLMSGIVSALIMRCKQLDLLRCPEECFYLTLDQMPAGPGTRRCTSEADTNVMDVCYFTWMSSCNTTEL